MRYYSHLATAAAGAVFLSESPLPVFSGEIGAAAGAGILIGAVLPDIDETRSWLGRRAKPLSFIIKFLFGHRGITHSGIVFFLAVYGFLQMDQPFFAGICFGIAAHITADLFSYGGVPLFYPFRKKRTSLPLYKTGSIIETMLFLGALAYLLIIFISW